MSAFEALAFWALAALVAAAAVAVALRPLVIGRASAPARAAHDVALQRNRLDEIARDRARGAITEAEAEAARREIGRLLLAADTALAAEADVAAAPKRSAERVAVVAAVVATLAALGLYVVIGAAGAPDRPLAGRDLTAERRALQLDQAQAEAAAPPDRAADDPPEGLPADFAELVAATEARLAAGEDDATRRIVLGQAYLRLERPRAAWPHFAKAVELLGPETPPELWADLGRAMALAAGGYVSREAEAVFLRAPDFLVSRFFLGQAQAARGEYREAIGAWVELYRADRSGPMAETLLRQISAVAEAAGLDGARLVEGLRSEASPAPAAPGPSDADVAAAAQMSEEDRAAMIAGMVEGLAARLAEQPDDLEGWLRLVNAYGVLGRADEARSALARARAAFANDAAALERLDAAARALEPSAEPGG